MKTSIKTRLTRLLVFSCVVGILDVLAADSNQKPAIAPVAWSSDLVVQLKVERTTFSRDEIIPIQVELTNKGRNDFLVGKEISMTHNWPYRLELIVRDSRGEWSDSKLLIVHPPRPDPQEPVAVSLAKWWVLLAPGYSYSRTLSLGEGYFAALKKPGRYRFSGVYHSDGFYAKQYFYPFARYSEGELAFPYPAWAGKVETNDVWIEIRK